MFTVTQLARKYGVSRTAILYYERSGLLKPSYRCENGYRRYDDRAAKRLGSIVAYRSYGLSIADIGKLLDCRKGLSRPNILKEHFNKLEQEIQLLRKQQKAIVALLQKPNLMEETMVTKERWVEIMEAAGFDEQAMITWHQKFEEMEPDEHQKFLESLGIDAEEIKQIRNL